jgi:diphthamide biosynthesis methyltransferase
MVTYEEGLKEILEEETAQKARLAQLKVAAVAMNREGSGSRRVSSNRVRHLIRFYDITGKRKKMYLSN